jgi:hypothetical protein
MKYDMVSKLGESGQIRKCSLTREYNIHYSIFEKKIKCEFNGEKLNLKYEKIKYKNLM